jgi:plasmid stability protein
MDLLKSADDRYGFNICKNAGSLLGHRHSPETKLKIGAAGKGRKATEETRAKLRARTWSLETIQKRRVKMIGHLVSLETRAKIRAANSGRKLSMEHRAKLRAAKLGKKRGPHSEETKAKMRKPHKSKRAEITRAQPET